MVNGSRKPACAGWRRRTVGIGGRVKSFLLTIVCLLLAMGLYGQAAFNRTGAPSPGSFSAVTENPFVTLRSEVVKISGDLEGTTSDSDRTPHFYLRTDMSCRFENTSPSTQVLDATFPLTVVYDVGPQKTREDYLEKLLLAAETPGGLDRLTQPLALPVARAKDAFELTVSLGGTEVPIAGVTAVPRIVSKTEDEYVISVTFSFLHRVSFPPGEDVVQLSYRGDYLVQASSKTDVSYTLTLGSGSTWKGPVDAILMVLPDDVEPNLPRAFSRTGGQAGTRLYLARNYTSAPGDIVHFEGSFGNLTGDDERTRLEDPIPSYYPLRNIANPTAPSQDFVNVRGASSALKDTADVSDGRGGIVRKAAFGALSLFDGVRGTAWAEGSPGDGIGEWVEFELKKDVYAVDVQDGFVRSLPRKSVLDWTGYYRKNNRVKTLEISSVDKTTRVALSLRDTFQLQYFALHLPAGVYRAEIRDVYRGTTWQDTCLGELTFHATDDPIKTLVDNDPLVAGALAASQ